MKVPSSYSMVGSNCSRITDRSFLARGVISGLRDALDVLKGTANIGSVRFSAADVVRHGLVAKIVKAYEDKSKKVYGEE